MKKKQEPVRKVMGIYPVEQCRFCGAEIFWMKCEGKRLPMDVEPVECVIPPIPGTPVRTVYSLSGFNYPATVGEDIPDLVENVSFLAVLHRCRQAKTADMPPDWVQEGIPL